MGKMRFYPRAAHLQSHCVKKLCIIHVSKSDNLATRAITHLVFDSMSKISHSLARFSLLLTCIINNYLPIKSSSNNSFSFLNLRPLSRSCGTCVLIVFYKMMNYASQNYPIFLKLDYHSFSM